IARVAPRVEGRIVGVSANLGDQVKAGQPLATLDSLAIGEASVALLQAQSTDRAAEADFKRASALNAE
ncbi:efflux RND transporter periplasmic adaptor subunit, partial [Acinetobacter baumannii]